MTDYTPTTEDVRDAYQRVWRSDWVEKRGPEFDRWLAGIKAQAWEEGWASATFDPNPYRIIVSNNDYDQLRNALDKEEA